MARDSPAKSVSMTAATGHAKGNNPDTAKANATVSHGENGIVKAKAAATPPSQKGVCQHARAIVEA